MGYYCISCNQVHCSCLGRPKVTSVRGERGDQGRMGPAGQQGSAGSQGAQGAPGSLIGNLIQVNWIPVTIFDASALTGTFAEVLSDVNNKKILKIDNQSSEVLEIGFGVSIPTEAAVQILQNNNFPFDLASNGLYEARNIWARVASGGGTPSGDLVITAGY